MRLIDGMMMMMMMMMMMIVMVTTGDSCEAIYNAYPFFLTPAYGATCSNDDIFVEPFLLIWYDSSLVLSLSLALFLSLFLYFVCW